MSSTSMRFQRGVGDPAVLIGATMGGALPFFNDAVTTAVDIKAAARGQLYFLKLINSTAAAAYVEFFTVPHAAVTLGTTAPAWTIHLAANEALAPLVFPQGVDLGGSAISVACVTAPNGATPAAVSISALYA